MEGQLLISGPTFASLCYDIARSERDIKGIFFGRSKQSIVVTIEDTHKEQEQIINTTIIQSFVLFGKNQKNSSFVSNDSKIDRKMIQDIINSKQKNQEIMLGWFSFRRNTVLRPSIKEIFIHQQISDFLIKEQKLPILPIFAIMNEYLSAQKSTVSFDYRFLVFDQKVKNYLPVQIEVLNLKETTSEEYSQFSSVTSFSGLSQLHPFSAISQNVDKKKGVSVFIDPTPPNFTHNVEKLFIQTCDQMNEIITEYEKKVRDIKKIQNQIDKLKK
ncbi:abraxas family member [Anaeramoeba ignava]|uniref:Abraxas family member n=1 Tax=Anaeramoeba ignava TaxID=1746090 RepID=A0A9Q0L656_ANAIG|nr:abraxas family member [Anaeramoeba ignava]